MKALTVSSEGSLVLKVGTGGLDSFGLGDVLSCATTNDTSRRTNQQQNAKRRMKSFPEINSVTYRSARSTTRRFWRRWESGGPSQRLSAKFSVLAQPAGACILHHPPSASPCAPAPNHSRARRQSAPQCASLRHILQGSYPESRRVEASQCPSDRGAIRLMAVFPEWPAGSPAGANLYSGSGDRPASWARRRSPPARPPCRRTACSSPPPIRSCFQCEERSLQTCSR